MAPAPPWRMSAGLNIGVDVIICLFAESSGEEGVCGVIDRFRRCYTKTPGWRVGEQEDRVRDGRRSREGLRRDGVSGKSTLTKPPKPR